MARPAGGRPGLYSAKAAGAAQAPRRPRFARSPSIRVKIPSVIGSFLSSSITLLVFQPRRLRSGCRPPVSRFLSGVTAKDAPRWASNRRCRPCSRCVLKMAHRDRNRLTKAFNYITWLKGPWRAVFSRAMLVYYFRSALRQRHGQFHMPPETNDSISLKVA